VIDNDKIVTVGTQVLFRRFKLILLFLFGMVMAGIGHPSRHMSHHLIRCDRSDGATVGWQRIMGEAVCTVALVPATTAVLAVWAWFGRRDAPAFP
jgi:hypothetical protein